MKRRRSSGQSLVEFSLILPILLLLLFGVIEFARFLFSYESLNNAVREGSRYAIVHGSSSNCPSGPVPSYVDESLNPCYDPSGTNVGNAIRKFAFTFAQSSDLVIGTPQWSPNNARGSVVTVTATYTFRLLLPLPFPPINMTATSTDVVNY